MVKLLVETTGAFQLVDHDRSNPVMRHEGYTVVTSTDFVQYRLSLGQVSIVAELAEEATDHEWLKYVEQSDNDLVLAREAFLSEFGKKVKDPEPPPQGKKGGPGKPVTQHAPAPAPEPASTEGEGQ
jgi:hypothetical protein